ncbi:hypothetical protein I4U23_005868 [Adineta vaga]|nr:hypothetical protein I4U23_005868 [Adineta vaga]
MHTSPSSVDQRKRRIKQISTGLCIFLFILSLVFPIYIVIKTTKNPINTIIKKNITTDRTKTIAISKPSLAQYSQLYSAYPEKLKCPCSQTSMNYDEFLTIQPVFHQICSSVFVTQDWIDSLKHTDPKLFIDDFRVTGSHTFQALHTLCEMSGETVIFEITQFFHSEFLNTYVMNKDLFQMKIMSRIGELTNTINHKFGFSFRKIQNLIEANVLFSSLQTNYQLLVQNNTILSSPVTYNECSCTSSSKCIKQTAIYDYSSGNILFRVPGFYTGCYIIESLLQSDLRCFYNQTCINHLLSYLSSPMNVIPLNHLSSNGNHENATIQTLLTNLMIDQWKTSISYENYYHQCNPEECTFTIEKPETIETIEIIQTRTDFVYMIALIIGIIGGIISILQFIIPPLVKLVSNGS